MGKRERSKPLTRTEALRLAGRHEEADAAQRAYARNRPALVPFTTTLWDYPSRNYGVGPKGDQRYAGSTPAWVIWQVVQRFTRAGETVLDPMCGSGTTIDVALDLGREAVGFDVNPMRGDIVRGDARRLPLAAASVDLAFIDPPYSTHIVYSDEPGCIGRLDAFAAPGPGTAMNAYYAAMAGVFAELHRVLRVGGHLALFVSDSYRKGDGFAPIGFELFALLRERFTPVDIVAVVRRSAKLGRGNWHKSAESDGFYMRGFNYLFVVRKRSAAVT